MPLTHSTVRAMVLALSISLTIAACGSSQPSSTAAKATPATTSGTASPTAKPHSGTAMVSISNYAYQPATITVTPGTKITFTNHDHTNHTATSTRSAFDTGTLPPGHSKVIVLHKPGTYTYYCQFHAFMHGTIIVR
jgi:plastocyanin